MTNIFFNVKEARECLEKNGQVYTVRRCKGKVSITPITRYARSGSYFHSKLIGKVNVAYINTYTDWEKMRKALEPHTDLSGFRTVDDWIDAVKQLNGSEIGIGKCFDLFFVEKLKGVEQENDSSRL